MSLRETLQAFLDTTGPDAGCEQTWRLLDVYVELLVRGGDPETAFPGISAHLATCGPCATDYEGLLSAVRLFPDQR